MGQIWLKFSQGFKLGLRSSLFDDSSTFLGEGMSIIEKPFGVFIHLLNFDYRHTKGSKFFCSVHSDSALTIIHNDLSYKKISSHCSQDPLSLIHI